MDSCPSHGLSTNALGLRVSSSWLQLKANIYCIREVAPACNSNGISMP
ncbi:MAG: hypothetical protein ACI841_001997 [Planctomycetota bacterium]|jgi:hypothetical protein